MDPSRTAKIEEIAARFCAAPLTAETVFLRPAYQHGQFERQVCDLLVAFRQQAIVMSLTGGRGARSSATMTASRPAGD